MSLARNVKARNRHPEMLWNAVFVKDFDTVKRMQVFVLIFITANFFFFNTNIQRQYRIFGIQIFFEPNTNIRGNSSKP
jgi:hypothetical protein